MSLFFVVSLLVGCSEYGLHSPTGPDFVGDDAKQDGPGGGDGAASEEDLDDVYDDPYDDPSPDPNDGTDGGGDGIDGSGGGDDPDGDDPDGDDPDGDDPDGDDPDGDDPDGDLGDDVDGTPDGDPEGGGDSGDGDSGGADGFGCTGTIGYWMNHPEVWAVDALVLGDRTYDDSLLMDILQSAPKGDVSIQVARQLIAAKLGVAGGADDSPARAAIDAADQWLVDHDDGDGIPLDVHSDPDAEWLIEALTDYNNGVLGVPHC